MMITQTTSQENRPLPDAESVGIGETEGEFTDIFGNKLLRFSYGEINVMITGTISKEELSKVAESMVAQKATAA
ncbi:MAG: DUF4367 domain-containing protein [Euryarchaeota archaeon]|nr:DUF4367 domain-containing protein [Euryarchaeota archaeon]